MARKAALNGVVAKAGKRDKRRSKGRKDLRGKIRGGIRLASAGLAIAAVTQELRRPKSERLWHGEIAKVPYDFRVPTPRRLLRRRWAPDNPRIIVPRAFGVGWELNLAALVKALKRYRANPGGTQPPA
jgi:hypothetical protein